MAVAARTIVHGFLGCRSTPSRSVEEPFDHLISRGMQRSSIFHDENDRVRFLDRVHVAWRRVPGPSFLKTTQARASIELLPFPVSSRACSD